MTTLAIPVFSNLHVLPVPAAPMNITTAIVNLLAEQPRKVIDMADMLGCSPRTIDSRLRRLEAIKQVHRVRTTAKKGMFYLWHSGPAGSYVAPLALDPEAVEELEEDAPGAGQPVRKFVSTYTIETPRDPMIAALFGPARAQGRAQP